MRILVFHTAFIGDIILMLPMIQSLKRCFPDAFLGVVTVPLSAEVLKGHPAVDEVIVYDKRGADRGVRGFSRVVRRIKDQHFDVALIPHRSMRSALACWRSGIPQRIGFSTSAGRFLLTSAVRYEPLIHETLRNLRLAQALPGCDGSEELPRIWPSVADAARIDSILEHRFGPGAARKLVALAPGSVWATKRWPQEYYARLASTLADEDVAVVLIGGREDAYLCASIARTAGGRGIFTTAGDLSLLESAELIRRCAVLVTNDSAPLHLGVAVETPVVALFGPTVPRFGFAPLGKHDIVVEQNDLTCRPCSIHGGTKCPIGTFDCMRRMSPETVLFCVRSILCPPSVEA
jgi:heptosyltransferase II